MTQNQLDWMQKQGLDPAQYDMTPDGRVIRRQSAEAAEPQRPVMSVPRAFGTSFLGSALPSAAGLGGALAGSQAGAALGALGGPAAPVTVPLGGIVGGIAGGLGAGYLGGKAQQAALEKFAPAALEELSRAEQDQPIASYLGGFAPNALAFRPSLQGMSGLLRPLQLGRATLGEALSNPNFLGPASNIAANLGASTAGQLVNVAEGGEFSAPRFAADVALGTLFNRPTALGRAVGFHDLPQTRPVESPELAPARERAEFMAYPPREFTEPKEVRVGIGRELEAPEQYFTSEGLAGEGVRRSEAAINKDYTKWWKSETEPTTELLKGAAEEVKAQVPRERLKELSQDPEVGEVLRDPSKMPAFIAKQADQTLEDVFQMMERRRASGLATAEEAANQKALQELRAERGVPSETALSDVEAAYAARERTPEGEAQKLYGPELAGPAAPKPPSVSKLGQGYDLIPPPPAPEVKQSATEAAREVYTRLQRPEGAGENRITQQDIDFAAEIAARRGLKIELDRAFAGDQEVRGIYFKDKDGNRIIRVNPLMATPDTAIHEIGHDIFTGVTNKGMRRSLLDTALDSPAYKAELAAREAEVKAGRLTPEAARDIALEEGLIQAFGEQMPGINRGELRSWFKAFKASIKHLATGKLSPEDALAWMHYASTEAVPWKGVAVGKTGEERMQRAQQETPEFKNWFGESQVVDEQGKPLVVYHGSRSFEDFNTFRTETGHNYGPGAYFTPEPIRASGYAGEAEGARVYPAYLKLENPYVVQSDASVQDLGYKIRQDPANADLIKRVLAPYGSSDPRILGNAEIGNAWLREQGYDGIIKQRNRYTKDGFVPEIVEAVAFNPEQVKSATANKGTFSPESKDIRYQRAQTEVPETLAKERYQRGILDKTLPEIDQITRRGGIYETVGRAFTRMYNVAQSMFGRSQAIAPEIYKLNDADAIKLTRHLLQEHRTRTRIAPAPEISAAYNEWRNTVKRFWVDENNAVGNTIRQGTGVRERLSDEFWLPFHKESADVRKILSERVGTPEYQKLKDDYVREATDDYLKKGMNQQAARDKAIADFEQERSVILAPFDPAAPATFAGARKPQGRPLPESWGELNFRDLLESYNRRSAKDYAAQMALERSPEVMTALGAQKMHNDQPIPASVLQSTPIISTDPSVQSILREFSGRPLQTPGRAARTTGSVASALALQTVSRVGDLGGTAVKPLAFVGLGDYGAYLSGMMNKLSNWGQVQARSIESGLNNPNAHQNFRQVISIGDDASKFMRKSLDFIGSITGSNWLEKQARTLAQAQGELIVSLNKRRASTGDKDAIRFLDTLNPDWRTTGDTDLAGQFGTLMQGSYDMRQLPAWFLEGGAAPYLTWSKWSMGQMNNFRKFAVEPAMQGNLKPLVAQVLLGMAGGGAIEQIQEWLNNKESKAINWDELQSWAEQNQGELGVHGSELLMQKLMMMAQKTGTFGFAGDLAMLPINALVGDTQGVIGAYPALDLVTDLAKNVGGALGAIDKGEDVGLVLQRFGKNVIVGKTQMLRVISNWADDVWNEGTENLRSADRRKQRLFDELNGMSRAGMFPVSYDNLSEQAFERGRVTEKTGEEAMSLVERARKEATTPEDYASRIRKLKTSQNQIMPSLERQPMKAARYLSWLEGTEEGKAGETMRRYMIRKQEDNYRKSLIEGLSGLR